MSRIVVGSTSIIKLNAVREVLQELKWFFGLREPFSVDGVGAKSKVSDQPVGVSETLKGAKNRCQGARRLCPTAQLWIGIENGMVHVDELRTYRKVQEDVGKVKWADVGFIWIEGDGFHVSLLTDPLYIPQKLIEKVYGEEGPVTGTCVNWAGKDKDPHAVYSLATINGGEEKPRQEYLKETILRFFQ
jgi:hypothetical protein